MTKINALYSKIDEIHQKIEEEPAKVRKRKLLLDDEIEELEDEKKHAGLKGDFSYVQQLKFKIDSLKQEKVVDNVPELKYELNSCKNEIIKIIIDYYKKGKTIDEIIKIENISEEISNDWLNFSNLGNETGYIFIYEINDDGYLWIYSNPITKIQYEYRNLDDLILEIKYNHETLFIYDENLAKQSRSKDLIILQKKINSNLRDLDNNNFKNAEDLFNLLKDDAEKFNEDQILYFADIMFDSSRFDEFLDEFYRVFEINKQKFDQNVIDDIHRKIIDSYIKKLGKDKDIYYPFKRDIFSNLKKFAYKFNEKQINNLLMTLININYISPCFDDLKYILNVNYDKINSNAINDFYKNLINNSIKKLNDDELEFERRYYFNDLEESANNFNEKQLTQLYQIIINKNYILNYYKEFKYILEENENKFDNVNYDEITSSIIDEGIKKLEQSDSNYFKIIGYLQTFEDCFSHSQLNKFSKILMNTPGYVCNNLSSNFSSYDNEFYNKIIDNRLSLLNDSKLDSSAYEFIMDDLVELSDNFNEKRLNKFIKFIINNININFAVKFKTILDDNYYLLDEDLDEIYFKVIDSRLKNLNKLSTDVLDDLAVFYYKFSKDQLIFLVQFILNNNLIQELNDKMIGLFELNLDNFDEKLKNSVIGIIIDFKLYKLKKLFFGYPTARKILYDLKKYVHNFTKTQITSLCNISLTNSQIYNCDTCRDELKFILDANKEKIDEDLFKETYSKNLLN